MCSGARRRRASVTAHRTASSASRLPSTPTTTPGRFRSAWLRGASISRSSVVLVVVSVVMSVVMVGRASPWSPLRGAACHLVADADADDARRTARHDAGALPVGLLGSLAGQRDHPVA